MTELVSILIPAYNAEKWIKQSIESALEQTWENKEIIVVDDGSSDRTLGIAKRLESKSVRVVTQKNGGASSARNRALALSIGDFIQWLDADDLLAPDKISAQMKVAAGGKSGLRLYSSPHGVFYHRQNKAKFVPNSLWQDQTPIDWLLRSFSDNLWMHPAGWLVSRRLTEEAGLWDERLSMADDGEYFARVVALSDNITFVNEARSYYRQSSINQLSHNLTDKALDSLFLSAKLKIQRLLSIEDSERTRKACFLHLQFDLPYFYPEKTKLLQQLNTLASELGGKLESPELTWLSKLLQRLAGPRIRRKATTIFRMFRLTSAVKWDEMMYRLGR